MAPYFGRVPQHQPNVIVNLNLHRSQGMGMRGFLHVPIECGKDLTPISRHKTPPLFFIDKGCPPNDQGNFSYCFYIFEMRVTMLNPNVRPNAF